MNEKTGETVQRRRTPAEIEEIVAGFAKSGLNRTEFCQGQRMSLGTLNRYLQRKADRGAVDGGLVAVELAGAKLTTDRSSACNLGVVLTRGRKIEVGVGFDAPTLQRLVHLLEKM